MKRLSTLLCSLGMLLLLMAGCKADDTLDPLPSTLQPSLPAGTTINTEALFGVWSGAPASTGTSADRFAQTFEVDFSTVEDGEALVSHWYTDAETESADSVMNLNYTYVCSDKQIILKPTTTAAALGASRLIGIYTAGGTIDLYSGTDDGVALVASLQRIGNPRPSVTSVDYTLPAAGEVVTITGRNLQFVDGVYFPTADEEWMEAAAFEPGSKQIRVTVPQGEFRRGALRLSASSSAGDCYTPPYMFATDCIYSDGTVFFGDEPIAVPVATGTDDKLGFLRILSSGESLQQALDSCHGAFYRYTPTAQLAIQMDLYAETDGEPVWRSGYISYRLNKDQNSLTSSMVANVALWDRDTPCSFASGWKTLTIPLSTFSATNTADLTIGTLIQQLKTSNLQTILTFINYPLDTLHPAVAMGAFRMEVKNIRLVPTE